MVARAGPGLVFALLLPAATASPAATAPSRRAAALRAGSHRANRAPATGSVPARDSGLR